MKTRILSIAVFFTMGFSLATSNTAKADCASDLMDALQNDIMNQFLAVHVIFGSNGTIYLYGPAVGTPELDAIIAQYNTGATTCPSAPVLIQHAPNELPQPSASGTQINDYGRR